MIGRDGIGFVRLRTRSVVYQIENCFKRSFYESHDISFFKDAADKISVGSKAPATHASKLMTAWSLKILSHACAILV